ncbi:hypothetical protein KAW65_00210 [candidate division WOR-3 bacterium]|nr:hypothetical protein [candidate division WOR-3 bacterium]
MDKQMDKFLKRIKSDHFKIIEGIKKMQDEYMRIYSPFKSVILEDLARNLIKAQQLMAPYQELMRNLKTLYQPLISKQLFESVQQIQRSFILPPWGEAFQGFIKHIKEVRVVTIRNAKRNKWIITPSLTMRLLNKIAFAKSGKEIDNLFVTHFKNNNYSNLIELVKKWESNSLFKSRINLIDESLELHKKEYFSGAVTLLLPQVEGIAREFLNQCGKKVRGVLKTIEKAIEKGLQKDKEVELGSLYVDCLLAFVQEVGYKDFGREKQSDKTLLENKSRFNRHAILHGFITDFGTEANSLRTFLLLDALSHLRHPSRKKQL